ncbi:heavy-metal-associated domain-containing protein [Mycolicibacterium litorale]|uniref:heavy-metal-associated domain-containing protein n=1 Tax=Mycolicibacterium litorale TaxID=758802 RepID=UPI00399F16F0
MNTAGRLAVFGAGLVVAFGGAYATAGALVPDGALTAWQEGADMATHVDMEGHADMATHGDRGGHGAQHESGASLPGLSLAQDGYVLAPVQAPANVGDNGVLRFQILTPTDTPLRDYTASHGKDLHLVVVRTDGYGFRHTHPDFDKATGTWSVPWQWDAAGSYRVFTDFAPADAGKMTLSRTFEVAGEFSPVRDPGIRTVAEVDGYTVRLDGGLVAGVTTSLKVTVTRGGQPVTSLEPYLGAFGHLVALRDGDLAYLHVHPAGDEPAADQRGGPAIEFATAAPTAGRYLLYLDFKVDGRVHTATFVVDAAAGDPSQHAGGQADEHSGGH